MIAVTHHSGRAPRLPVRSGCWRTTGRRTPAEQIAWGLRAFLPRPEGPGLTLILVKRLVKRPPAFRHADMIRV